MSEAARRLVRVAAALAFLAGVVPALRSAAQQVTFSGKADPEADRRIAAILSGGRYTLLARDTTIPAGDTLRGPVLATGIRLRLNGAVAGDLVGVASDLFLHPRSAVTGALVNAGGGLYASSLATVGETVDRPLARYVVTRSQGGIHIEASPAPNPPLALDALKGLHTPTYDRVDGLWLQLGAGVRLPTPPALDSARLHLVGGWRTGGPGLSQTVDLRLHRGRYTAAIGESRLTATPDRWVRGDLVNSLAFLTVGNDSRDYYDARRIFAFLARDLDSGAWSGHVGLRALREDAAALRTRDPFVLFKPDTLRPNPEMSGRIASLGAEATARWSGRSAEYQLGAEVERAGHALGGDVAFGRYAVNGTASLQALWGHTLDVQAHVQGPLPGTTSLPRQRWSHVGGPATLPTWGIDAFPGDRVVFVSEEYVIPLPGRLRLPLVGTSPALAIEHAIGKGWSAPGDPLPEPDRTLEQNLGAELRLFGLALSAWLDPAHARDSLRFGAGFSFGAGRIPGGRPYFDTTEAER